MNGPAANWCKYSRHIKRHRSTRSRTLRSERCRNLMARAAGTRPDATLNRKHMLPENPGFSDASGSNRRSLGRRSRHRDLENQPRGTRSPMRVHRPRLRKQGLERDVVCYCPVSLTESVGKFYGLSNQACPLEALAVIAPLPAATSAAATKVG